MTTLKYKQAAMLAAQGMSVRNIAEVMNIRESTVRAHLYYYRKYAEDGCSTIGLPIDTYTALKDKGGSPAGFAARKWAIEQAVKTDASAWDVTSVAQSFLEWVMADTPTPAPFRHFRAPPIEDGWIEHDGKGTPAEIDSSTMVQTWCRGSGIQRPYQHRSWDPADNWWDWSASRPKNQITHYRIVH